MLLNVYYIIICLKVILICLYKVLLFDFVGKIELDRILKKIR